MGPGITLLILGAILAFAVRADASAVDLQTVGLIFMVAGAAVIAYSRRERRRTTVVEHVEKDGAGADVDTAVHETVTRESLPEHGDVHRHP
ncbi:MAG: DUF6458 family protein [Actinomycetota bacterium]